MSEDKIVTLGAVNAYKKVDTLKSEVKTYISAIYREATVDFEMGSATQTLSGDDQYALTLYLVSASAAASIVAPASVGRTFLVVNKSGQTITIKSSAGATGIDVANNKVNWVVNDGTDYDNATSAIAC
jgi:hypothetical protein